MRISINHQTFAEAVPRLIHQTYSTLPLPSELAKNTHHLRQLNPGWKHLLWDDAKIASFIFEHYGQQILEIFNRINPDYGAARADLFRYLLLYRLGGVYLDIKSAADLPLDNVIRPDDTFILSQWRNGVGEAYEGWGIHEDLRDIPRGEYQQWHIIAGPGHPFLRAVIERVLYNLKNYRYDKAGSGRIGVLRLTGPIAYTKAIHPLISAHPHRIVTDQSELGFRYSIFERDGRQYHHQAFKRHYAAMTTPIVKRPFPHNLINHILYKARSYSR